MGDFIEELKKIGFVYISKLGVNYYRKEREYYSALAPNGDKVFIKYLNQNDPEAIEGFDFEKRVCNHISKKVYAEPTAYMRTCIITEYVDNTGNIKDIIKKADEETALKYIRNSFQEYLVLLECLNKEDFECRRHSFNKLLALYIKRWAYYSKKPKIFKDIAYHTFKLIIRVRGVGKLSGDSKSEYVILGDLNPGNCICDEKLEVHYIDFEKVCCSDPNIDMASYFVKICHHARKKPNLVKGIEDALEIFRKSHYYQEKHFNYARSAFELINKYWS